MSAETERVEPPESEQDEEEDVYEVERIIDMRTEEGEVLYRVRWKNYCSDDDTWEPEAHLEDCREVLLAFKKNWTEAPKEPEAKKSSMKLLPTKSDVFDADSESDNDKDRPTEAPIKKKKKKKIREEEEPLSKEKKKKKKDKRKDEFRPLPAPETDDDEERASTPPREKKSEFKKRPGDSEDEDDEPVPVKKHKKDKGKDEGKKKKERGYDEKKKKLKRDQRIETSEDEAAAALDDDLSDVPSETKMDIATAADTLSKSAEKARLDEKSKQKKGKWEVKLQGIKDLIHDKKAKKPDGSSAGQKDSSFQKVKTLTSKSKEDTAPHSSDSSDGSTLQKKAKVKGQESSSAPAKAPSSSSSSSTSSITAAATTKGKDEELGKEEVVVQKDATGSTNLFEKFLLNCEAKDRAPRRQAVREPSSEKGSGKPTKLLGKMEKIPKSSKESPAQKLEPEKTERTKQFDVSRPGQSYGFSLDSDEREGEESTPKPRPGEDSRDRRERSEEAQRSSWERRTPTDDRRKKREDSEPRLFMACDDSQDMQDSLEASEKSDKGQATLSLGMDLNLDWMTLDDFQKHLNGEDEILSGPPLSPSELREAVKNGEYMAVKLALNSKEDYNLDQEENTVDEKRSFEGERSLIEERSSSEPNRMTPDLDSATNEEGSLNVKENTLQDSEGQGNPKNSCYNSDNIQESPPEKDTTAVEDVEMSCDTNSVSGDLRSFNSSSRRKSEGMQRRGYNKTKKKNTVIMNDSSDEAKDVESGPSSCADNVPLQFDKSQTAKRRSGHRKRAAGFKQPTRSSLRTCKRVAVETPSAVTSKKEASKKHFCLYCKMAFTQLVKHLETHHAQEADVAHAMQFPKGSKNRQTLLDHIRNKGDYEHNCKVQKSGEGEIVMKKQVKNSSFSSCVRDYLPCQHCFAFYRKTDLWRHEQSCKAKKGDQKSPESTKRSDGAASRFLPMSEFLTESCEEIIHAMHQDDIARHIRNDPLICKYGNTLSTKYDHDKSQFAYIAQKMRELGRFILAVNELDKTVQYLHEICLPSRFELAVEGAKKLSGFDPSSTKFKTFSLVSKIHYSLKRAAEIAFGESRMTEDSETEGQVKKFIQLLDTKWNGCFSRKALASSAQKLDVKKVELDKSTVTEDLIKLYKYIKNEGDEARKELKENPSLSTWKKLSEAALADVCLFNRRRVGNIGRLLLQSYTSRKALVPSADQMRKSTKLELDLGDKFTRLELEGQYGRNMLILLTERMILSIDILLENREQAGVSKTNPYLFARAEGPSFIRALDCFRRAAMECGVKNPETLLSSSLRDQIACCWQLMSLSEQELDQVAAQTGRSSEDCYRLHENASQLEEVSRQLLRMDRKMPICPAGTGRDGTVPKAPSKRKPWSEKEQAAVKRYLWNFITMMKVPGKKDCNACIAAEPDLLGRSWTDVKSYVHNTVQTVRRKSNQQRCDVTQTAKKDLADAHAAGDMGTVQPSELRGSSSCNMTTASPSNLTASMTPAVTPFPQDMTSGYVPMSSAGTNVLHAGQPLISSFTPLNAADTQVVPTFTPPNVTDTSLMPSVYTAENTRFPPLPPVYTQQNTTGMPLPPVYTQQDISSSSVIPTFTPLNAPSTPMAPRFTQLSSTSTPMVPGFSTLFDESRPLSSSFTPLGHSSPPAYPTSPPGASTTSQVVPTIHPLSVPDRASMVQERTPVPLAGKEGILSVKPQKRTKRLWSEEEQSAVRRQLGDFCKLVKVPGKKDCDACLAAEPALSTRTWREVKYFVHNSIQSMKRRNALSDPKPHEEPEQETSSSTTEWDGPVYLSL